MVTSVKKKKVFYGFFDSEKKRAIRALLKIKSNDL